MNEINVNINNAKEQYQELKQIARDIKQLNDQDLRTTIASIKRHWKGQNADAYVSKAQVLQRKIGKTAQDLDQTAETLREIVENLERTEAKNMEIMEDNLM